MSTANTITPKDIIIAMQASAEIKALYGSSLERYYWEECKKAPDSKYMIAQLEGTDGEMQVEEKDRIEFLMFNKDTMDLESDCKIVRDFFTGTVYLNGVEYKVVFLGRGGNIKLKTGFFITSLRFIFRKIR